MIQSENRNNQLIRNEANHAKNPCSESQQKLSPERFGSPPTQSFSWRTALYRSAILLPEEVYWGTMCCPGGGN